MINASQLQELLQNGDGTVVDTSGSKIGKLGQVYLDDQTGDPEWVTVTTGLFGTSETFVPLANATLTGNSIQVAHTKDDVKDAPRIDTDGSLSQEQEAELYDYYGVSYSDSQSDSGLPAGRHATTDDTDEVTDRSSDQQWDDGVNGGRTEAVGHDTSGPTTDAAMTRSEEQLHVGTERVRTGTARLRKFIVTEQQQVTVPVSHEEVRIEREPITDANRDAAMSGPDLSEEEHEVVLHAERPVVQKETVPVERVRLDTETITETEQIDETVRKEQIETDADGTDR